MVCRAYVHQPFHEKRSTNGRLGLKTMLRPCHRGDYVEAGLDLQETGGAVGGNGFSWDKFWAEHGGGE